MYRLDKEQQDLVDKIKALAEEHVRPHAGRVDEEGVFPQQAISALAEEGFLGLTVPVEYGGMGQSYRVACAALEVLGNACASTGMVYLMHLNGIACYEATPEVKAAAEALRAAARGEHLSTLAWSEKGSGSHFWAPMSRALEENGSVKITAEKSWVTSANHAQGYVVSTGWAQGEERTESMLYLVLDSDPGFSVAGPWNGLGMRGNASAPMHLEEVTLDPGRALSQPGKGLDVMLGVVLPRFQTGNAAVLVGIAEAAVQTVTRHLLGKRLEHLDMCLADDPTLRARLAQMRIETDRARAHLVSVLDSMENPGPATQLLVLEVKAAASEAALRVVDLGMRACGGSAFSKHLTLERHFRDARAPGVMAPTTDSAYEFIGRALCGMEVF